MSKLGVMGQLIVATTVASFGCAEVESDPMKILELADTATSSVPAIAYDFSFEEIVADGSVSSVSTGSILLERMVDSRNYRMRAEFDGNLIVADGDRVSRLNKDRRTVQYSSIFSAGSALRGAVLDKVMEAYLKPAPFRDELAASAIWERVDEIGGVKCDVVRVDYEDDDEDSRWCFDADSHLPLQLEWISDEGSERLRLLNVSIDPERNTNDFVLEIPEGYTEEPYGLGLAAGTIVPDWNLLGPDGVEVTSAQLLGRIVVLDFWASWCPPCLESMPALQELHEDLSDESVAIFGVQVMDEEDPVAFMSERNLTYSVLVGGEEVLESTMGGASIPSFVVIDHQGSVIGTGGGYFGEGSDAYLRSLVQEGLGRLRSAKTAG
jgi:thiol-disulfide isomerase/thioredoxin